MNEKDISKISRIMFSQGKTNLHILDKSFEVSKEVIRNNEISKSDVYQKLDIKEKDLFSANEWVEMGWFYPLHLYSEIRDQDFIDKKVKNKIEKVIPEIKKYIKKGDFPGFFKIYKNFEIVRLPSPTKLPCISLEKVMLDRRTCRSFAGAPVSVEDLSNILNIGCKQALRIRRYAEEKFNENPHLLTYSLFTPFEVYLVVLNVEGLEKGVYHYNMKNNELEIIKNGDYTNQIYDISRKQFVDKSSFVVLISAVYTRYMWRYRHPRAYINLLTDAGRLAHKFILSATSLNLKNFLTPAIKESSCDKLLGLDGWKEGSLYLVAIGK